LDWNRQGRDGRVRKSTSTCPISPLQVAPIHRILFQICVQLSSSSLRGVVRQSKVLFALLRTSSILHLGHLQQLSWTNACFRWWILLHF
jgi:hypothetical protein